MKSHEEILELTLQSPISSIVGNNVTIREYLRLLLSKVWNREEGFSGKRPFGISNWQYDLYIPLVKANVIDGKIDEDGFLEEVDDKAGHDIINDLIDYLFDDSKRGIA
jgi:hypothetical protein